jgi:hypothetical protein
MSALRIGSAAHFWAIFILLLNLLAPADSFYFAFYGSEGFRFRFVGSAKSEQAGSFLQKTSMRVLSNIITTTRTSLRYRASNEESMRIHITFLNSKVKS